MTLQSILDFLWAHEEDSFLSVIETLRAYDQPLEAINHCIKLYMLNIKVING